MKIEIPYQPQPRQQIFHVSDADECLYGGAAGGGKTEALLWEALISCLEVVGYKCLYLRRTFPDLERSVIRRSRTTYPKELGKYNEVKHLWTFVNASTLEFGSLDKEMDVLKYQSAEYDLIIFDELTHFTEYQYTYMTSRNRTTLPGVKPRMRAATNPGGVGHGWVKAYFIDPAPAERVWTTKEGTTRCFIPAKVTDNLILMERDPKYIQRLKALPENERKALLDGDWDVFAGQVFKEWRKDIHVIEPFAIPPYWNRYRAIDPGYNDPLAVLWIAVSPDNEAIIYRELYGREMKASDSGQKILELSKGEDIIYTTSGPDAWAKRGEVGETVAETWMKLGIPCIAADKSPGSRINGKMRIHEWLAVYEKDGLLATRLKVFSTCINFVRTFPALIYDDHRVEDISDKCEDHLYEALKDWVMSRPAPAEISSQVQDDDDEDERSTNSWFD